MESLQLKGECSQGLVCKNRVIAVVPFLGETSRPPRLRHTVLFLAEIPAPWALAQVAADRRHVANLRGGHARRDVKKCGPVFSHLCMRGNLGEGRERPIQSVPLSASTVTVRNSGI